MTLQSHVRRKNSGCVNQWREDPIGNSNIYKPNQIKSEFLLAEKEGLAFINIDSLSPFSLIGSMFKVTTKCLRLQLNLYGYN